jgi:hypothetical protein
MFAHIVRLSLAATLVLQSGTRTVDFEKDIAGNRPGGFTLAHTAKVGQPGEWVVQSDAQFPERGKFLAQTGADPTQLRFPVATVDGVSVKDVDLRVMFYPVSGNVDQAAGIVFRYQDEDNYYVVRANARENNVVLYKVEKGKRVDLPLKGVGRTYGERAQVPAKQWSELRVVVNGNLFAVHFGGRKLFEVEDDTFRNAGKVGVWTKADSITYFDNLVIAPLPSA